MADGAEQSSKNLFAQTRDYVSGSVDELRKVSKPTHQETVQFTLVTVVIICFIAICLVLLDMVFRQIMNALL